MNNPPRKNNNGGNGQSPWSTAACYLFQSDGFLCGAINGLAPDSPSTYGVFSRGQGSVEEEELKAAMKNFADSKFQPHLCEDREFFVIQNGAQSVDVESLTSPSSHSSGSESSFKLEAARDGVPSFEQDQILETPYFSMPTYTNEDEPETLKNKLENAPIISSPNICSPKPKPPTPPKVKRESTSTNRKGGRKGKSGANSGNVTPSLSLDKGGDICLPKPLQGVEVILTEEDRLRKLLALYPDPPNKEQELAPKSDFISQRMKSLVPSCMEGSPPATQQPMELTVTPDLTCGKVDEDMKEYWTEKFTEAANKVIQSKSTQRCMEIVDPTIPRSSDKHRHVLRGRQRYRKVLQKYRKHRILVLILDPKTKLYEMLELPYRPEETTVADILIMARIQTTDDRLRYKEYVGLCRPNLDPPPPPLSRPSSVPTQMPAKTPPRHPLMPPRVNRVTQNQRGHDEGREDETSSLWSDVTANTTPTSHPRHPQEPSGSSASMLQQITDPDELVWNLLTPSRPSSPASCTSSFTPVLPYFTLPLLGDIVVTIPKGYSGEEVSRFAQSILQTPLFLRWMHRRYLNDLERENDELLSRAAAVGGTTKASDPPEMIAEEGHRSRVGGSTNSPVMRSF